MRVSTPFSFEILFMAVIQPNWRVDFFYSILHPQDNFYRNGSLNWIISFCFANNLHRPATSCRLRWNNAVEAKCVSNPSCVLYFKILVHLLLQRETKVSSNVLMVIFNLIIFLLAIFFYKLRSSENNTDFLCVDAIISLGYYL